MLSVGYSTERLFRGVVDWLASALSILFLCTIRFACWAIIHFVGVGPRSLIVGVGKGARAYLLACLLACLLATEQPFVRN